MIHLVKDNIIICHYLFFLGLDQLLKCEIMTFKQNLKNDITRTILDEPESFFLFTQFLVLMLNNIIPERAAHRFVMAWRWF